MLSTRLAVRNLSLTLDLGEAPLHPIRRQADPHEDHFLAYLGAGDFPARPTAPNDQVQSANHLCFSG